MADAIVRVYAGATSILLTGTALVQPLVDTAVSSATAAAASAASAQAAAASAASVDEVKRKWEILLGALASGEIRRGVVELEDYGITDWPNPFGIKRYWTGSILYPMLKMDSNFRAGAIDGNILWIDPATGDRWRSVSLPKSKDPALDPSITLTYWHVDPVAGNDSNIGSAGAPFKSLDHALATWRATGTPPVPGGIVIHGSADKDWLGVGLFGDNANNRIPDGGILGIYCNPAIRRWLWLSGHRDYLTLAAFDWQDEGDGVWSCSQPSLTISDATKKCPAQVDALNVDEDGIPSPLTFIGPQADLAATIAAIKAVPGSCGYFGTTDTGLTEIVHCVDGRIPDPKDWWHDELGLNMANWIIGEGALLYTEKLARFSYSAGITSFSGFHAQPIVVAADGAANTGQYWVHDFAVVGSSGQGIQVHDMERFGWDYGVIKHVFQDAENIHSFKSAASGAGNAMAGWSSLTKIDNCGRTVFGSAPASTDSNQVSSVHDQITFERYNQVGNETRGASCADVAGAQTLSINCHPGDPNHVASGPPGSGSPKTAWWCDGAGGGPTGVTIMRTLGCSGKVPAGSNVFSATNAGEIRYAKQIGDTTSETYAGGVVTNVG